MQRFANLTNKISGGQLPHKKWSHLFVVYSLYDDFKIFP